jgi:DNA-binding MarR family transcriptional regulator
MSIDPFTKPQLDGFHDAAQSLKLYRRAELETEAGVSLIEDLYVDPLPNDHVYQTMLKPNTTFIIGRKGTGKSTVFQRARYGLRRTPGSTSAYIDIKTVYESSQVDPALSERLGRLDNSLSSEALRQLLLYQAFLKAVINAIREELSSTIRVSFWDRLKPSKLQSIDELFEGLDDLLTEADVERYVSVTSLKTVTTTQKQQSDTEQEKSGSLTASLSAQSMGLASGVEAKATDKTSVMEEDQFAGILMRTFNTKDYIIRLKKLLQSVSITRLYIFVDDFSELPEPAMRLVVDTLLAPLNNWSEELIKFKVAGYPGRVYYGAIDRSKIDEINLDLYSLYGTSDVAAMEEKAIDFTRRLVEKRLEHYCGSAQPFFDQRSEEIWRLLFYATMGNPRNLGYILFYVYESQLIYGKSVTATAIRDAARRYYEEKVDSYFVLNKFLHESFAERSSTYSLKELLDAIVKRARQLRSYTGSAVLRDFKGRPPTSHFHIISEFESLLSTLELNFFLTKYFVMSDRDGRKVSVFALNYGLCQKYAIEFGRPTDKREHRVYFVERVFDYTSILQQYMETNQEIICNNCNTTFEMSALSSLQFFDMLCPNCRQGHCTVTNLSRRYEGVLREIDSELLLPSTELGILNTLQTESRPMFASEIASDLDCSYQLVGKRGKFLGERGLVNRAESAQGRRVFEITNDARQTYFRRVPEDDLDID